MNPPLPVVAISPYGIDGASTRVRLHDWFAHTGIPSEHHGYLGTANNRLGTVARRLPAALVAEMRLRQLSRRVTDRTVILSRGATPFSSGGIESTILRRADHSAYDFDDALYVDESTRLGGLWSKRETWARCVRAADVVIAGSDILADAASEYSDSVTMIPSCIEPDAYEVKTDYEITSAPRAVWIGSPTTEVFLHEIADALLTLHRSVGLRLTVISGGDAPLGELAPMVDRIPWSRATFATDLLRGDFGLMPLPDTPFTRGKCSYKLLQYAAAGLPLIGSPVGANRGVLDHLGGLAADTTDEWVDAAMSILNVSTEVRSDMGRAMREGVIDGFSYGRWEGHWRRALGVAASNDKG